MEHKNWQNIDGTDIVGRISNFPNISNNKKWIFKKYNNYFLFNIDIMVWSKSWNIKNFVPHLEKRAINLLFK